MQYYDHFGRLKYGKSFLCGAVGLENLTFPFTIAAHLVINKCNTHCFRLILITYNLTR